MGRDTRIRNHRNIQRREGLYQDLQGAHSDSFGRISHNFCGFVGWVCLVDVDSGGLNSLASAECLVPGSKVWRVVRVS